MKIPFFWVTYAVFSSTFLFSQHQETSEKPIVYKGLTHQTEDSASLLFVFKNGQYNGHFRYFFMATENESGLSDYFANAVGGGLHYNTAKYHGFQFGISGFYIFNIYSSVLSEADQFTGQKNRYEIGLFDQENPHNHKDIDRLEELFLKYSFKKNNFTFGRQLINTPFINLQDGRMRPTGVEGVWIESEQLNNTKIEGGFLYAISPRSTTKWYRIDESIGLYPSGIGHNGKKSDYFANLKSKGVGILGVTKQATKFLKFQAWDVYVDNIFNSLLLQTDLEIKANQKNTFYTSGQFIYQNAIKDGCNSDPDKSYFSKKGVAFTYGSRLGFKNDKWDLSFNFNRISDKGRYLFPREWGRDPFFTFMPRERNEGAGNSSAFVIKANYKITKSNLKTSLAIGYFNMPDVTNFELNKYQFPSYFQINTDVRYSFSNLFKGLDVQFLFALKLKTGETYDDDRYVINKVNMANYNLVLNYHF